MVFPNGDCTGTVRGLYGDCTGTVRNAACSIFHTLSVSITFRVVTDGNAVRKSSEPCSGVPFEHPCHASGGQLMEKILHVKMQDLNLGSNVYTSPPRSPPGFNIGDERVLTPPANGKNLACSNLPRCQQSTLKRGGPGAGEPYSSP